MSLQDISYIERSYQFKQKLTISKEMLKLAADFYTALRHLGRLEDQKIEQLRVIKNFSNLFYEQSCPYKPLIDQWGEALDKEIEALKQRSELFLSMDNFANKLKKAYEPLQVGSIAQ